MGTEVHRRRVQAVGPGGSGVLGRRSREGYGRRGTGTSPEVVATVKVGLASQFVGPV